MDAGVAEPLPTTTPSPPAPLEPSLQEQLSAHEIASALADSLSIESLVRSLGEAPPGLSSSLFNLWLEHASPIPYHPRVIEFVYEELPPLSLEDILEELGEEGLELMLYASLETPHGDEEERELEEFMDHHLTPLLRKAGGEEAVASYQEVKRAFASHGRPGWMAAKSVWAHLLNNALNHTGL